MTLTQVIEALVFASPKPLLTREILAALRAAGESSELQEAQDFAKVKEADALAALAEIQEQLAATGRAFQLVDRVNGWTLVSDPMCAVWVRQLYPEAKPTRLTGPQLETLAIIAYRQPVTRADIEVVRGVAVDGVMQVLLDRGLVKIAGRAEVPGRPLLYSTTEYFLQHFGLKSTDELPNASELKRVPLPTAAPAETAAAPAEPAAAPTESAAAPEEPAATPAEPAEPAAAASEPATLEPEPASTPEVPSPEFPETTTENEALEETSVPSVPSEPEDPSESSGAPE
jgi:segregation and condensation protein B